MLCRDADASARRKMWWIKKNRGKEPTGLAASGEVNACFSRSTGRAWREYVEDDDDRHICSKREHPPPCTRTIRNGGASSLTLPYCVVRAGQHVSRF